MMRVVFAEWRKLRRPTLFLGTLGAALFFTGLTNTFLYLMIDSEQGNGDRGRQIGREVLNLRADLFTASLQSVGYLESLRSAYLQHKLLRSTPTELFAIF
jgi:hypothetical protein